MTVNARKAGTKLRIVFAGTPEFAAQHLRALLTSEHEVCAVYTQPDRPSGRGKKLSSSPVKVLAEAHTLPVLQPSSLKAEEVQHALRGHRADIMVVVAYGLLLPAEVLAIPRYGCINVHASLLPRWRGAAPIQRAIEAGDEETGVTIMQMDVGLDTGPMWHKSRCAIAADATAAILHDRLVELGCPALLQTLDDIAACQKQPESQPEEGSCYAKKIDKQEARIDWTQAASVLARRVRAFVPFPVCYAELEGKRWRILSARVRETCRGEAGQIVEFDKQRLVVACGEGELELLSLQLPGKTPMSVQQLYNGYAKQLEPGTRFDR